MAESTKEIKKRIEFVPGTYSVKMDLLGLAFFCATNQKEQIKVAKLINSLDRDRQKTMDDLPVEDLIEEKATTKALHVAALLLL